MKHTPAGNQTPTYHTWREMHKRCYDTTDCRWPDHGGMGIKVHESWHTFEQFQADMGEKPSGLILDRIDLTKGFEPGNVHWVTSAQYNTGRRSRQPHNSLQAKCWAAGLPYLQVWARVHRLGWSEERALSEPIGKRGRPKAIAGRSSSSRAQQGRLAGSRRQSHLVILG